MTDFQAAQSLLMVRPTSFGFDKETAQSNAFQHKPTIPHREVLERANTEFQEAVETLQNYGVRVIVFEDAPTPEKPDAVFPNNWLSTWSDGTIYLYPMATESRRIERTSAVIDLLREQWEVSHIIDLSASENEGKYLESTGVMIFDHIHKIVYGCLSIRCDEELFATHATSLGYKSVIFHAVDNAGIPIYHTNVLMGVQSQTAAVCLDVIKDPNERELVIKTLEETGHVVIPITEAQMGAFCGNILEVKNTAGKHFIALSQTAYDNFTAEQRSLLSQTAELIPLAIPTIETIGGGSIRCMMAEIFLPKKKIT